LRHDANSGETNRQVSARFRRQLSLALLGGVLLMAATCVATWWMARQQDDAARASSERMVSGGIEDFAERTKKMLLDYAIWTDAYQQIRAGDIDWIYANMGASADIGTFDLAVVVPPGGVPVGWQTGSGPAPTAELLDPLTLAEAVRPLEGTRLDEGAAAVTYARSGGALWLLAAARVVPQEGVPSGARDADLPRLIIGHRITTETFDTIRRRRPCRHRPSTARPGRHCARRRRRPAAGPRQLDRADAGPGGT
jgi:sensor domain CHASE-containing protein